MRSLLPTSSVLSSSVAVALALVSSLLGGCAAGGMDDSIRDRDDAEEESQSLRCGSADTGYHASAIRCGGIAGAFTASSANIGYYPVVALRDTPLYSGDFGPGRGGRLLRTLSKGDGFAIQSTRNPTCNDAPPMRPAVNGFVYGLTRSGSEAGWIRLSDIASVGEAMQATCADGPGSPGTDFQVARNAEDGCKPFHCASGRNTCKSANGEHDGADDCDGGAVVDEYREVDADTLHLRYAQGSTSIGYAHRHDRVRVSFVKGAWAFIEVTNSTCPFTTPVGMRAWTMLEFLRPIVPGSIPYGSSDPSPAPAPDPEDPGPAPDPGPDPDPDPASDPAPAPSPAPAPDPRYCCAKCSHREVYHRVDVTSGCTDAARAYCKLNDRGTFQDAMWGSCAP
jgi:hypothetical protein